MKAELRIRRISWRTRTLGEIKEPEVIMARFPAETRSPDGKRVVMARGDHASDIVLLGNFRRVE